MNEEEQLPKGWDARRVRDLLDHYESQTEDEAVAEDEAPFAAPAETVMQVPAELVPIVRELIARHRRAS